MTEQEIRERFFSTRDAGAAVAQRTARVDSLVRERWSAMPAGTALVATGGYGRSELFPYSDIDLLILTPDEKSQEALREPLAFCLRDLWDQGLRISQSVHTPLDCNQIDELNAELAVSLLDRRLLAGDPELFFRIRDPRVELGRNIAVLTRERHARFQNTIYHLEPNLKDSPGGLRDLQVLRWLAKLGSGDSGVPAGVPVLFQIRCYLHYLAGRDDNKLSFDRQDEIAAHTGAASPEALMREYYRAVTGIARLANRRLEKFEAKRSSLFSQFRDRSSRLSNTDFTVLHGQVFVRGAQALDSDPGIVLRLFEFVARHGLPLATDTEERVERAIPRFREWVGAHQPLWRAFRDLLRLPHPVKALRFMHASGALEALFPELEEMNALVIRDFYHRYTVDEHTLVAIGFALELREKADDPFGDLARETEDPDLLAVALLFHDVGKGTPDEAHCDVSVRVARAALEGAGISPVEWDTVSFLIGSHLILSAAMNGRDLSDPATARDTAAKVGTVERLKLLTLMTYADISAVHPTALTPWRRQLLWNLYTETYAELTRELGARISQPQSGGGQDAALNPALSEFLEGLPPRYRRTHSPEEIEAHAAMEAQAKTKGVAVALKKGAAYLLTVVGIDHPGLFASIAGTLSSFGFNILKAEAFSNAHGTVVDTFTFADPSRTLELNPGETDQLLRTVARAVKGEVDVEQLLRRRPPVRPDAHALRAARTSFDNTASPGSTLLQLVTQDRPGLLFDVASLISKHGGDIDVVVVDTEAKKAIDVFYVRKNGRKLSEADAEQLTGALNEIAQAV